MSDSGNNKDNSTNSSENRLIPILSIALILVSLAILFFLILPDLFPPSSNSATCGPGLCVNDINTGQKTCPGGSGTLSYDPSFQTCNPAAGCNPNSIAPCIYSDLATGTVCPGNPNYNSGNCPNGETCPCVGRIFCPDFATVYFNIDTITTPGLSPDCTNLTVFVQNTVWTDSANLPRSDLPLSPGPAVPPPAAICGLTASQLPNIWPPNTCIQGLITLSEADGLYYCTNAPACPSGQIPFLQTNGEFTCTANENVGNFE